MRKILILLLISSLIPIYHAFFPEIEPLRDIYAKLLRPFYNYKIDNLICREDFCLYISKDCVGVYTFLMSLCFYFLIMDKKDIRHIILILLLSFLVDYIRLSAILLSKTPRKTHTILTLLLPLISYFITTFIKKMTF